MVAVTKQAPAHMTVAEFADWDNGDRSGRVWQLVDGEPVAMAPATQAHGAILNELGSLLRNHLVEQGSRCRVIAQPGVVPRARANENFRIPDLGVTCSPEVSGLMTPDPVLLVEILSPNNQAETRANVWAYTTIPTVREILLVHSTRMEAELLRRNADETWPATAAIVRAQERLELVSVGLSIPLTALYRTTGLSAA
jgi:Uma2 family endonuclease